MIIRLRDLPIRKADDVDWQLILDTDRVQLEIETLVGRFKLHRHERFDQIFIIRSGTGIMTVGGEQHAVASSDVIVIPAGTEHGGESGSEPLVYWGINVPLGPS